MGQFALKSTITGLKPVIARGDILQNNQTEGTGGKPLTVPHLLCKYNISHFVRYVNTFLLFFFLSLRVFIRKRVKNSNRVRRMVQKFTNSCEIAVLLKFVYGVNFPHTMRSNI